MITINYCQKCGRVMECTITYQCGLPRIRYYCPYHGSAIEYQVTYSTNTSGADMRGEHLEHKTVNPQIKDTDFFD